MVAVLASIQPIVFVLDGVLANSGAYLAVQWAAYCYMGVFGLVLPFLVVRDLVCLPLALTRSMRGRGGTADAAPDPERRRFMTSSANAALLGLSGTLSAIGVAGARRRAEIVEIDLPIPGLPPDLDGYRIVQLSDIHAGLTITADYVEKIVAAVARLDADLVAVTGDLVDGTVSRLDTAVSTIGDLRARDGVFFVTGNHEYYRDAPAWCQALQELGLTVLTNEHRIIERGVARMLIAGVTDLSAGQFVPEHASDPKKAMRGAPPCDLRLLLAHQPRSAPAAARAGFDLQLSGHTHGGQFFPWTLFIGLAHPFEAGLSRIGEMALYVSRGTGYWGPPMRLGAPSEIGVIRLIGEGDG